MKRFPLILFLSFFAFSIDNSEALYIKCDDPEGEGKTKNITISFKREQKYESDLDDEEDYCHDGSFYWINRDNTVEKIEEVLIKYTESKSKIIESINIDFEEISDQKDINTLSNVLFTINNTIYDDRIKKPIRTIASLSNCTRGFKTESKKEINNFNKDAEKNFKKKSRDKAERIKESNDLAYQQKLEAGLLKDDDGNFIIDHEDIP